MLLEPRTSAARRALSARVSVPVAIAGGSLALAALSLLLPSTPTYDPWAWIIWGREITQFDLDTVDGPSWKPLPVLLTTVFALFGDVAPDLWLVVARAGAIASVPLAFLLAHRLAGPVAGVAAAAGIALAPWTVRNGALGNSEGLLLALLFAAVLAHERGRRGWAFALALAVGMLRPEAWPFVGLYSLWLLRGDRSRLPWVAAGVVSLPLLWLGPEWWGSGNPLRASDRAQQPNPGSATFAEDPALAIVEQTYSMVPLAAVIGVALLLVLVLTRRVPAGSGRVAAALAVMAASWVGLVAFMTTRGFSGNARYLMPPAALIIVLGAAGLVWALRALAGGRWAPPVVAVAAAVGAVAFGGQDAHQLERHVRQVEYEAALEDALERAVDDAGGPARLRACGHAYTNPLLVPQVAWQLEVHGQQVDLDPDELRPAVVFHVRSIPGNHERAPAWAKRGRTELAREGSWIVTGDCEARG